jgi:hypothetical protein
MSIAAEFLIRSQVQYLATIGMDDKPKVRPWQFMLEESGRLYFCTFNQKPVFKEMQRRPHVPSSVRLPRLRGVRGLDLPYCQRSRFSQQCCRVGAKDPVQKETDNE